MELRESAPWRAWAAARDRAAAAEPEWSAELRADARRARDALTLMARDELALARAADAVARRDEDLPPRQPAADELARKRAFLDRFAVPPPLAIFGSAALCLALFLLDLHGVYGDWCHVARYGDFATQDASGCA